VEWGGGESHPKIECGRQSPRKALGNGEEHEYNTCEVAVLFPPISILLTGSGVWQKGIPIYPTY
jgi:hypothetical protein